MIWFVMLGLYFSCSGTGSTPQKSATYKVDYQEDLSAHRTASIYQLPDEPNRPERPEAVSTNRPEQTISLNRDITEDLNQLLTEVAEENKRIRTIPGFTIQVYSGSSREQANLAKRQVYHVLPETEPEIKYMQPNYKVQVGQFVERLEAQKIFSLLKKEFPSALIIPDRIKIN